MGKCEHGLTSAECFVCASPKRGKYRTPDEDILKMARKAGFVDYELDIRYERFANLVRAAEQDRCCRIIYGMAGSDNVAQRTVDAIRNDT